jgi:predicted double-glycine peptidase
LSPAVVASVIAAAATLFEAAPASSQTAPLSSPIRLLEVPYVPQTEELCGGAAVAMVMRYWGATGIYAESFWSLVDREQKGIRGEDLISDVTRRGWGATSFRGDAPLAQRSLEARRPLIALIEDRPGRFHYVVIVSWASGKVVVHDPARRPFQVLEEQAFLRKWERSGYWTLLALPPPAVAEKSSTIEETPAAPTGGACGSTVDEAVQLANRGQVEDADRLLERATAQCPGEPAPWRELAGVRVLHKDWRRAAAEARKALAIDPRDEHAARILATSLYLAGDTTGALGAWNLVGEPTVDLVDVRGLERTRYAVAVRALKLPTESRLTPDALTRAARRLDSMPSVMGSNVSYAPRDDGLAQVTAAVIERPVLPTTVIAAGAMAAHAAIDRELKIEVVSPTGGGERWLASWRWWESRPRVFAGLEAPAPFGGTWQLSGADERESYGSGSDFSEERRRSVSMAATDWMTATLKWDAELRAERWPSSNAAAVLGGLRYQSPDDRLALGGRAGLWASTTTTWTAGWFAAWRSSTRPQGTVWLARAGLDAAGKDTPLALWSGAGTGHGRDALLRAHPLLHDGVIRDGVFGRVVAAGGAEWRRWRSPALRVLRIAPAAFVDVARAYDAPAFAESRAQVDVGAGVRLAIPGAGVLRADIARGLRDGEMAVSVGWTR